MATVNCILTGQEKGISDVVSIENGGTGAVSAPSAVGNLVRGLSEETTMADGDYIPLSDTSASGIGKKISKSNLKTTLGVSSASSTTPKVAGTAAVGTETAYARGDHVHPAQTSVSGNAGTATKLATGRTIRTNLASTSTATFDGSANITPGVTGVLPIANGGTGGSSASSACTNIGALPLSGGTMTGNISMNGHSIVNLGDPGTDTSAASKKYVDNYIKKGLGSWNIGTISFDNTYEHYLGSINLGPSSSLSSYDITNKNFYGCMLTSTYGVPRVVTNCYFYNCVISLVSSPSYITAFNNCQFYNCFFVVNINTYQFTSCSMQGCTSRYEMSSLPSGLISYQSFHI